MWCAILANRVKAPNTHQCLFEACRNWGRCTEHRAPKTGAACAKVGGEINGRTADDKSPEVSAAELGEHRVAFLLFEVPTQGPRCHPPGLKLRGSFLWETAVCVGM